MKITRDIPLWGETGWNGLFSLPITSEAALCHPLRHWSDYCVGRNVYYDDDVKYILWRQENIWHQMYIILAT